MERQHSCANEHSCQYKYSWDNNELVPPSPFSFHIETAHCAAPSVFRINVAVGGGQRERERCRVSHSVSQQILAQALTLAGPSVKYSALKSRTSLGLYCEVRILCTLMGNRRVNWRTVIQLRQCTECGEERQVSSPWLTWSDGLTCQPVMFSATAPMRTHRIGSTARGVLVQSFGFSSYFCKFLISEVTGMCIYCFIR